MSVPVKVTNNRRNPIPIEIPGEVFIGGTVKLGTVKLDEEQFDAALAALKAAAQGIEDQVKAVAEGVGAVAAALKPGPTLQTVIGGGLLFNLPAVIQGDPPMATYKVQDDHADEPYTLNPVSAVDNEGNNIALDPPVVESTDPNVVSVDAGASTVHFGAPGVATINETVKRSDTGEMVAAFNANFIVTAGAVSSVTGGGINFPGLTPEPETPPPAAASRRR